MDDPMEIRRRAVVKGYQVRMIETLQQSARTGEFTDRWFCIEQVSGPVFRHFPLTPAGLQRAFDWITEKE